VPLLYLSRIFLPGRLFKNIACFALITNFILKYLTKDFTFYCVAGQEKRNISSGPRIFSASPWFTLPARGFILSFFQGIGRFCKIVKNTAT
jgi:hypothetical protein